MDRVYHSCAYVNLDRTQKLIAKNEKCLIPANKCFWKDTCDTRAKMKTRAMTRYFKSKEKDKGVI